MEKALFEKVFLKNTNIDSVLKETLKKHIKFLIFANIRFTLVHNCLIKAIDKKLYKEDLSEINRNITKICVHLDEAISTITNIITTKNRAN